MSLLFEKNKSMRDKTKGPTEFVSFENNLNSLAYFELLRYHLIPFAFSKIGLNAVILQDNDSKHSAFINKNLIDSSGLIWKGDWSNILKYIFVKDQYCAMI
ncbi:hypothetical protein BpHYR1_002359 [Brachionus plicatilis]|uniref:Uncharacterized protein n=1 Tax=Brachionus plicatilis TaxID=10195 RepID=A0A3M7Q5G3_BRAPC|nr:hypothetical protein BpHYR1_002359 [Brachionus plicatilis]